jgi:hypothetical protein
VGVIVVCTCRGIRVCSGSGVETGTLGRNPEIDCGFTRIAITITVIIPAAKNRISPFSTQSTDLLSIKTVKVFPSFIYDLESQGNGSFFYDTFFNRLSHG